MVFAGQTWTRRSVLTLGLVLCAAVAVTTGCDGEATRTTASNSTASDLPTDDELRDMIDEVLLHTYEQRHLNLTDHAAWQILHGALPFGRRFQVYNGDEKVSAVDWIIDGNEMNGWTLRHGSENLADGRRGLKAVLESGSKTGQGHEDQWLAILAQCELPSDHPIKFRGEEYQLGDILLQAMHDVYDGKECSWTVISLSRYLPHEHQWQNSRGETWNMERIMAMEARQDIVDASACGGTHRLIGMTMALDQHLADGGEVTGGWLAAKKKIVEAVKTSRAYQQPSGAFSTAYFRRAGTSPDKALEINTTGHTLEFLTLALTDEQLTQPWVTQSVVRLCDLFRKTKKIPLECGSLYHAAHGLISYRERRFGPFPYPDEEVNAEAAEEQTAAVEPVIEEAAVEEPTDVVEAEAAVTVELEETEEEESEAVEETDLSPDASQTRADDPAARLRR